MNINCIIVEDEPLAQERIKGYISKLPFLHLLASFDNGVDALVFLRTQPVDLVFLDINIGEFSGIQLLETAHRPVEVIITTAYDGYALKGFDLNVRDYLLKPFTFERFIQAVDKVRDHLGRPAAAPQKSFIFIKTAYRLEKLLLQDVLYIEGMRDYRRIHTTHKWIMTLQTFREFEQEIPASIICRVHKSFMVAIDKIDAVEKDNIQIGRAIIPISDTYKKAFYQLITAAAK
ncbi:response regulator transcription factor [Chitinophaga agrisoli]|uniref:Response regulator transcription factor n=1 Tax=Chitinophaga agrisoli TaxID=2607653 RepID=A0A5B2VXE8_9BACT|nr:response regulator transcription factor [Chitinophaga agrisoli]KAA2242992.1 response regulator transcription factor [Chitinophaga agrisoli]